MKTAYLIDAVRSPIGRYGGGLSEVRPDDLAAHVISELVERTKIAPDAIDDVIFGCANQAGEDNRNVARMALLLAGLPVSVPGVTVNRLCGSGLQAVADGARQIMVGEVDLVVAGGVESMSRAPLVMAKATTAFPRGPQTAYDTTLGWRFVNPRMRELHGTLEMGQTAEAVAERYAVTRAEQDAFAVESQRKAHVAIESGRFDREIVPVKLRPGKDGSERWCKLDEHPRPGVTVEKLAKLKALFKDGGTVTAGSASGINDGSAAVLLASEKAVKEHGLTPMARYITSAAAGVEPSYMGLGPIPATQKALSRSGMSVQDIDLVEINEAFAAQAIPCVRELGFDPAKVNVNGGAIALGHPLGATGARMVTTLLHELSARESGAGLVSMCIGVGQGIAVIIAR